MRSQGMKTLPQCCYRIAGDEPMMLITFQCRTRSADGALCIEHDRRSRRFFFVVR